jgi:hypothetical protein
MEDRIQINGVWYVRENKAHVDDSFRKYMQENVVTYQCITYEDSDWLFQGHADLGKDRELNFIYSIQIENKLIGKSVFWDNIGFIRNFNASTYEFESDDNLDAEGAKLLQYFIDEIKRKGWL